MGLSVARAIDRRFERAQMVSQEELALNDDDVNQKNIAEKIERLRKDLKNDHFGGEDTTGLHLSK